MPWKLHNLPCRMRVMGNIACVLFIGLLVYLFAAVPSVSSVSQKTSVASRRDKLGFQLNMAATAEAGNEFTLDLYNSLREDKVGANLLVSPFSAHMALSMTLAGAKGDTSTQMKTVLHLNAIDENKLHESMGCLGYGIMQNSSDGNDIRVANRVYSQEGFELVSDFVYLIKTMYDAPIESVNFAESTETAALINAWVEEKTENKIKDLISSDALNGLTRMVLVNALYFKGQWNSPFNKNETQIGDFYTSPTEVIKVNMMHKNDDFSYGMDRDLNCQVLEIPFADEIFSFVAILPAEGQSLAELQSKITKPEQIKTWVKSLNTGKKREVTVFLPKFKVEDQFSLNEPLVGLGMSDAFDEDKADFSGMSTSEGLYISDVVQKTFFEVTEEGAEAAAATGVIMCCLSLPENIEFIANRPFMYFLMHKPTESILFIGHLAKPDPVTQK